MCNTHLDITQKERKNQQKRSDAKTQVIIDNKLVFKKTSKATNNNNARTEIELNTFNS